jgi:hypothetical protein
MVCCGTIYSLRVSRTSRQTQQGEDAPSADINSRRYLLGIESETTGLTTKETKRRHDVDVLAWELVAHPEPS